MKIISMKDFKPLTSHQAGIKIQKLILVYINESTDDIVLDFSGIEICTDSFLQQLITILVDKITYKTFKEKVKFSNLNNFLKDLIKANLLKAYNANKTI